MNDDRTLPPARLAIVRENLADAVVVHAFGELDLQTAPELERAIEQARDEHEVVVVDFSECRYLDSTTLSVLVRAAKVLGRRLRLIVPSGTLIARLLAMTQLDTVLCVVTSLEAATASISFSDSSPIASTPVTLEDSGLRAR